MDSSFDLARAVIQKCGTRYDPVEYAKSQIKNSKNADEVEQWKKVAEILQDWSKG